MGSFFVNFRSYLLGQNVNTFIIDEAILLWINQTNENWRLKKVTTIFGNLFLFDLIRP